MASSSILLTITITIVLFLLPSTLSEEEKPKIDLKALIAKLLAGKKENTASSQNLNTMTLSTTTNDAFQGLDSMTLFAISPSKISLSTAKRKRSYYYTMHVLPKYYSMDDLATLSEPVPTLANGTDSSLYITHVANQLIVSNGVVKTPIRYAMTEDFPLAVYVIDQVLWPVGV